jgi:predicted nucleic acid-binding protein
VAKTRTFIDAGVLIYAARGDHELSQRALAILDDPNRDYITSDFVRLEVVPKAIYNKRAEESAFYEVYFRFAAHIEKSSGQLVVEAQKEAEKAGLSAIDALHIAAARRAKCDEFITAEKQDKPLFRIENLNVLTIRPPV